MAYFVLRPNTLGQLSVNSFLTAEECRSIIDEGERDLHLNQGTTGDQRTDLRKSDIAWLSPDGIHQWLFERVKDCVNDINRNWFGFNLLAFEGIQFTKYSQNRDAMGDHYGGTQGHQSVARWRHKKTVLHDSALRRPKLRWR